MKTLVPLAMVLCTVLTVSAVAQQSGPISNASASQAASQPETATGKDPLPVQHKPTSWWDGDDPGLAWLVLHPFASKKYVHRNTDAIKDRLNELDQLTSANSKQIQDVDTHAQQGIQLASSRTKLADDHASEAASKAQMAYDAANAVNTHLAKSEAVVAGIDQYKSTGQTEIRFRPGQTELSKQAKDALDAMATPLKGRQGYIIEVQGFSAGHGQAAIANSRKVADSVVRYLMVSHEVPSYRIYVIGMGNTPSGQRSAGTRVEISVLNNELEQAAK